MTALIRRVVIVSGALVCCIASPAGAEEFTGSLSAAKPSFGWSGYGAGGPGFECSNEAEFQCDLVMITLENSGDLNVAIDVEGEQITNPSGAMPYPNLDLYLFAADASGAKQGEAIAEAATPADDEKLTAPALPAGKYLLEVRSSLSIGENYGGKAKLSNFVVPVAVAPPAAGAAPAAAEPAPAHAAPPNGQPKQSKRAACRARAKKIKRKSKRARAMKRCAKLKR